MYIHCIHVHQVHVGIQFCWLVYLFVVDQLVGLLADLLIGSSFEVDRLTRLLVNLLVGSSFMVDQRVELLADLLVGSFVVDQLVGLSVNLLDGPSFVVDRLSASFVGWFFICECCLFI